MFFVEVRDQKLFNYWKKTGEMRNALGGEKDIKEQVLVKQDDKGL